MKKRIALVIISLAFVLCLLLLIGGLSLSVYMATEVETEVDEYLVSALSGGTASRIYYYEDEEKRLRDEATELEGGALFGGYHSVPVYYEELPPQLIYAFVSIEDKRFFEHSGVDWRRTFGAALNSLLNFDEKFGGSTITQQLIKNVTGKDEYSVERKLQEILWALDLETKLSKTEILENYLNIINLSNGCYGVGAAAEYYFSKAPDELSLAECAAIAAITNNPSYYDPVRNPQNNVYRRNLILSQMYEQGYIDELQYTEAAEAELMLNINSGTRGGINLWYTDMVVEDVISDLAEQEGYSRAMASHLIYTGGLKIYSAMDKTVQSELDKYYGNANNFYVGGEGEQPQSAMIIIDPYSGDILGVAGAIGEKNANRLQSFATSTVRPAGSVIKPLSVYAPALEYGVINYASVYDDVPVNFGSYDPSYATSGGKEPVAWPKNANGVYRGLTNINYAVEHSVNTVTVRVLQELGLDRSFTFLKDKLHINSIISGAWREDGSFITDKDYAALALGQFNYGVTLREITAAYSIFPNRGIHSKARSYYKVTDGEGNIILENDYRGEAVISEGNATVMNEMLSNVVANGTASALTLKEKIACAGKTGTTQNNNDRWYIGYTPYLIGGVWYGYEYPKELNGESKGICIRIWDDIMTRLHSRYILSGEAREFERSAEVITAEYCVDSGLLATDACRADPRGNRIEKGYFVKGSEPQERCGCHILVEYDSSTEGGVVSHHCAYGDREYVGLIRVERSFPIQIYVSDAQYVWRELDENVMPETNPALPFFCGMLAAGEFCGISRTERQFNRYCRTHFDYYLWKRE